jgi:hypothetical protein
MLQECLGNRVVQVEYVLSKVAKRFQLVLEGDKLLKFDLITR